MIMQASVGRRLSVVVPMYNEQDNVDPLVREVSAGLAEYDAPWELILVDDGSADETPQRMRAAAAAYGKFVRVVTLQRNFGQTAAMQAGIDMARGDVIATLDGDLQNDPRDIPRLVDRLVDDELDLIVGWRKDRKDNLWLRKIPSRIANRLISRVTHVELQDYGCSLKVYRSSVIKGVRLYGEMHRFIPAWMALITAPARIKQEPVNHRARQHGQSKYGISRTFRVLLDLLSVYFFMRFVARPGHFFGSIGLLSGAVGGVILSYLLVVKLFLGEDIGTRPLLLAGVLLVVMAVQFLTTGVLSELIARTYFSPAPNMSYQVRNTAEVAAVTAEDWKTPAAD
jgi:glycosyltransferase involved in cell wall biosynthesis